MAAKTESWQLQRPQRSRRGAKQCAPSGQGGYNGRYGEANPRIVTIKFKMPTNQHAGTVTSMGIITKTVSKKSGKINLAQA